MAEEHLFVPTTVLDCENIQNNPITAQLLLSNPCNADKQIPWDKLNAMHNCTVLTLLYISL